MLLHYDIRLDRFKKIFEKNLEKIDEAEKAEKAKTNAEKTEKTKSPAKQWGAVKLVEPFNEEDYFDLKLQWDILDNRVAARYCKDLNIYLEPSANLATPVQANASPVPTDPTFLYRAFFTEVWYPKEFPEASTTPQSFQFFTFFSFFAQHFAFQDLVVTSITNFFGVPYSHWSLGKIMLHLEDGFCEVWFRSLWTGLEEDCRNHHSIKEDSVRNLLGLPVKRRRLLSKPPDRKWFVGAAEARAGEEVEHREFLKASNSHALATIQKMKDMMKGIEHKYWAKHEWVWTPIKETVEMN